MYLLFFLSVDGKTKVFCLHFTDCDDQHWYRPRNFRYFYWLNNETVEHDFRQYLKSQCDRLTAPFVHNQLDEKLVADQRWKNDLEKGCKIRTTSKWIKIDLILFIYLNLCASFATLFSPFFHLEVVFSRRHSLSILFFLPSFLFISRAETFFPKRSSKCLHYGYICFPLSMRGFRFDMCSHQKFCISMCCCLVYLRSII